jgi:hypothetical protein
VGDVWVAVLNESLANYSTRSRVAKELAKVSAISWILKLKS